MYHAHFGLTATPFSSQAAASSYVPAPGHEEALARLEFLAETQSGSGLLLGAPGSGKSLLLEVFARQCRRKGTLAARISAAQLDEAELLFGMAVQFGVSVAGPLPASRLGRALNDRLAELRYDQVSAVLLVDDIDRVSESRLASVDEMLTALPRMPLLTIVLAGTHECLDRLPAAMGRRADLRIEVPAWEEADVQQFVTSRLAKCGCLSKLFDDGAIAALFEASGGNPRHVSQLANLALIAAAANGQSEVDAGVVEEVCRELCVAQG